MFDDDPLVTEEIRAQAAHPGSVYSLKRVEARPSGIGLVVQDVVLGTP